MEKESDYLLSNQEILGGLNSAIKRGESLKDAMMTFYQAGYDKTEIEEAARALLNQQKNMPAVVKKPQEIKKEKPKEKKEKPEEKKEYKPVNKQPSAPEKKAQPLPVSPAPAKGSGTVPKHVSAYGNKKKAQEKPKNKMVTIILIFALLILLGVLAAVFLFKEDLVNFINGLLI